MAVSEVPAADVPPVPSKLIDALLAWHSKVLEVSYDTFPLVAQRQDAPLTQMEALAHRMKQLDALTAVARHELRVHYDRVRKAYRAAA